MNPLSIAQIVVAVLLVIAILLQQRGGGLGGLFGTATLLMKLFMGVDMTGNPLLLMTVLAMSSGIQLMGLGFLAEINVRTYYETQQKPIYVVREVVHQEPEQVT